MHEHVSNILADLRASTPYCSAIFFDKDPTVIIATVLSIISGVQYYLLNKDIIFSEKIETKEK